MMMSGLAASSKFRSLCSLEFWVLGLFTQGRYSYKSAHLGARSVMLRIPLPEDDRFALR